MKKPNQIYKKLGPKSRMGTAYRNAHHAKPQSLRSAFRGVEWVVAGTFSGATLCKFWVQKLMAAMAAMKRPYQGRSLSSIFRMINRSASGGSGRSPAPQVR